MNDIRLVILYGWGYTVIFTFLCTGLKLCKLLLCNGTVLAMYGLVFLLVPAGSISQELRTTALAVSLATLVMGNVAFVLYDRALHNMLMMYRLVWRPKLHKTLGWR